MFFTTAEMDSGFLSVFLQARDDLAASHFRAVRMGRVRKSFLIILKKRFFPVFSHREMPDILINFAPEMKFRFRARFRNLRRDARVVADRRYGGIFSQFVFRERCVLGRRGRSFGVDSRRGDFARRCVGQDQDCRGAARRYVDSVRRDHVQPFRDAAQRAPVTLPERIRIDPVRLFDRAAGGA